LLLINLLALLLVTGLPSKQQKEVENHMYVLHCTKKLLDRIKEPTSSTAVASTTVLGNWYATALFWQPQLALLVNERTLLPVLMPLAPATTLAQRFPARLEAVLAAYGIDPALIAREAVAMAEIGFAKTANRSLVGIMNEFSSLAESDRRHLESTDLVWLSMRLANTPCSPIKYNSPARLLKEIVAHSA
jgi:hypothetical protein